MATIRKKRNKWQVLIRKRNIKAISKTLSNEDTRTKDLKGNSNTKQCADAVLKNL